MAKNTDNENVSKTVIILLSIAFQLLTLVVFCHYAEICNSIKNSNSSSKLI